MSLQLFCFQSRFGPQMQMVFDNQGRAISPPRARWASKRGMLGLRLVERVLTLHHQQLLGYKLKMVAIRVLTDEVNALVYDDIVSAYYATAPSLLHTPLIAYPQPLISVIKHRGCTLLAVWRPVDACGATRLRRCSVSDHARPTLHILVQ
jgi:hypothetical protein